MRNVKHSFRATHARVPQRWTDRKLRVLGKGSIEKRCFGGFQSLVAHPCFVLGDRNLKRSCQTAFSKLTLSGGPFNTSQVKISKSRVSSPYCLAQGGAVQSRERGPDHPEGKHRSRWLLDFSVRAGLNVFPCKNIIEKCAQKPKYLWEDLGTPAPTWRRAPRPANLQQVSLHQPDLWLVEYGTVSQQPAYPYVPSVPGTKPQNTLVYSSYALHAPLHTPRWSLSLSLYIYIYIYIVICV